LIRKSLIFSSLYFFASLLRFLSLCEAKRIKAIRKKREEAVSLIFSLLLRFAKERSGIFDSKAKSSIGFENL